MPGRNKRHEVSFVDLKQCRGQILCKLKGRGHQVVRTVVVYDGVLEQWAELRYTVLTLRFAAPQGQILGHLQVWCCCCVELFLSNKWRRPRAAMVPFQLPQSRS